MYVHEETGQHIYVGDVITFSGVEGIVGKVRKFFTVSRVSELL